MEQPIVKVLIETENAFVHSLRRAHIWPGTSKKKQEINETVK